MSHPGESNTPVRTAAGAALRAIEPSEDATFEQTAERLGLPADEVEGCLAAIIRDVEENDDGDLARTVGHCFMLGVATGIELERRR